jgi:hypothetical protein
MKHAKTYFNFENGDQTKNKFIKVFTLNRHFYTTIFLNPDRLGKKGIYHPGKKKYTSSPFTPRICSTFDFCNARGVFMIDFIFCAERVTFIV